MRRVFCIVSIFFLTLQAQAQVGSTSLSELDFNYLSPKEYELGPIRVYGADNYDHQAIRLIAGPVSYTHLTLPTKA